MANSSPSGFWAPTCWTRYSAARKSGCSKRKMGKSRASDLSGLAAAAGRPLMATIKICSWFLCLQLRSHSEKTSDHTRLAFRLASFSTSSRRLRN